MLTIRPAKEDYLRNQNNIQKEKYQSLDSRPSLWPSDLLSCKRKAAYHILNEPQSLPFSDKSLSYMNGGNVIEDDTGLALKWKYDAIQNFALRNNVWSGKADFIIGHGSQDVIIVEHKATGESKFKGSDKLPRRNHVAQLALYGYLYKQKYDIKSKLILYYEGWGHFAEFELSVNSSTISVTGMIDNQFVSKTLRINIAKEIEDLERMYKDVLDGKPLPDKLDKKYKGCEFMGKPSCQYYHSCWSKNNG